MAPEAPPTAGPARSTAVAASIPVQVPSGLGLVVGPHVWPLVGTRILVGRAGGGVGADVEVDDASMSRRHAEIVAAGGTWSVRDLGSTNGTWLGDRRLTPGEAADLAADLTLRFGTVAASIRNG
jgi:hypothetical protein